ncbi:hypothetical protein CKO_00589 [Citrobacter koseri ATCC BAA-895]|uniref:Uncharacterized protein n=1 Tax=Citrobacter koseri (strain ATCC BAA-895 / CDC 4225-83 / SGSC4696) TaxID=290338 RepID=A8AE30_CITK8|nr:hypothetical protein CKO_00589 [Citrobacter koseri ATCC BAA-895]
MTLCVVTPDSGAGTLFGLRFIALSRTIKKPRRGGVFLQLVGDYARTKSM